MISKIKKFYKGGVSSPLLQDSKLITSLYQRHRMQVFLSITLGYGFYYVSRLALSVAKKPMLDAKVMDVQEMGLMGSAMLFAYGIGKFANGFLADRCNMKRFIPTGLFISALINLLLGFTTLFWVFVLLWALNGWFQSMGAAPSIVSLSQWFSNRERGTYYGIWYVSHNIGEAITFVGIAFFVSTYGWQYGFGSAGAICVFAAIIMYHFMSDRPETLGLPNICDYKNDHAENGNGVRVKTLTVKEAQLEVLKNPAIWILGISSACMYISRYAVNNWAVLFLQETKNYSLMMAGSIISSSPIMGILGSVSCGFISDRFFRSRRNIPNLLFSSMVIISLLIFYYTPPGHPWIDTIAMGLFGVGISASVTFLGGLMAVDISSRSATGAAMGLIGVFSYAGATLQDAISGYLLNANKVTLASGAITYDFGPVILFWIGAAIVATLLPLLVWNAKAKE
ncbi:MAG: MFS transporter [Oligoflexia bacterium]|nr:MFS transporter [Oligoflexia bacterium]